jgi:hypothetical protein
MNNSKCETAMVIQKCHSDLVEEINKKIDRLINENKAREFVANAVNRINDFEI